MKKIVLLILIAGLLAGCQAGTKNIVIENKSDFIASLYVDHIKEDRKITLTPMSSTVVSLYEPNVIKNSIRQLNITRNNLHIISEHLCTIENSAAITYTVVNTTIYDVKLVEHNALFDSCDVLNNSNTTILTAYSPNLNIKITVKDNPSLNIPFQYICIPQDGKIFIKL